MRHITTHIVTGVLMAAASVGPATAGPRQTPDAELAKLLSGRVAGEPARCINLPGVRSTRVIGGKAIVYEMGSRLYVNAPRGGADQLRDDDILVTRVAGGQLCNIDTVQLVDRASQVQRGFVVLGDFVPYTRARRPG